MRVPVVDPSVTVIDIEEAIVVLAPEDSGMECIFLRRAMSLIYWYEY